MRLDSILFFTLVNLLNYFDRYLLAALLPQVQADFNLKLYQSGQVVSAFVFGYFIFSPVFGYLGDRFNRPKLMTLGVLIWSVATVASGIVSGFAAFLAVRVLVGIGEASFTTIAPGYFRDRLQNEAKLSRVLAVFFAAIPVGSALGFFFAGLLSEHYPWQVTFLVGGIPGLLACLILIRFPESPQRTVSSEPLWRGLKQIAGVKLLWFAIGGYILNSFGLNGIASFLTSYGQEIGFELASISKYFGLILVVTGLLGTLGGGQLSAYLAAQALKRGKSLTVSMFQFTALSAFLAAPFIALAFSTTNHSLFLVACFFGELFVFAGVAPVNAIIVTASPKAQVTLSQSVCIFALNLFGSLPSPQIIGYVADFAGLSLALQLSTLALFLSGVVWWLGSKIPATSRS